MFIGLCSCSHMRKFFAVSLIPLLPKAVSTYEPLQGDDLEGKELGLDVKKGEVVGSGSCSLVSYTW